MTEFTGTADLDPTAVPISVPRPAQMYASFGSRLGAFMVDGLAEGLAQYAMSAVTAGAVSALIAAKTQQFELIDLFMRSFKLSYWAYYVGFTILNRIVLQGLTGASIGKRAFHLRVESSNGKTLTLSQATGRYFATWASAFSMGIGYLMVFWHPRRQALHDVIAKTVVVQ